MARDPETAARVLREALELWRGPALLDVAAADFFRAPVTRLSELRMAVLEDRIEADLRVGRGRELTGELPEGRWRGWPMPSRRPRPAALPTVRRGPGLARGPTGSQGGRPGAGPCRAPRGGHGGRPPPCPHPGQLRSFHERRSRRPRHRERR
ncbi:BTAD domain-containing putative transcriptional regulator [Streptomyces sp. NPDC060020]|uniref:BTAD domain-containing putative transcriptional regulator n=1 Tax=Streptomyces sp. NPDC060020 TaxID=3347038 RepID=UPI0036C55871